MNYYSAKNEYILQWMNSTWMNLEDFILREISQKRQILYSQKKDFILRDISQKRQILYSQKNTVKKRQILYNFTYMNQNHKDIK